MRAIDAFVSAIMSALPTFYHWKTGVAFSDQYEVVGNKKRYGKSHGRNDG